MKKRFRLKRLKIRFFTGETKEKAINLSTDGSSILAEWTGLEPATPGVTGRYSNQLNYHSW